MADRHRSHAIDMGSVSKTLQNAIRVFGLVLFVWGSVLVAVQADESMPPAEEGRLAFDEGRYDDAVRAYELALEGHPDSLELKFNLGTALHKAGRFEEAVTYLQQALLGEDSQLTGQAHFNLGNNYYQLGQTLQTQNAQQTLDLWEEAVKQYEQAQVRSEELAEDAAHNRTFVEQMIQLLKQNQQPSSGGEGGDEQQDDSSQQQSEDSQDSSSDSESDQDSSDSSQSQPQSSESSQQSSSGEQDQNQGQSDSDNSDTSDSGEDPSSSGSSQQDDEDNDDTASGQQPADDQQTDERSPEQNEDSPDGQDSEPQSQQEQSDSQNSQNDGSNSSQANTIVTKEMTPEEAQNLLNKYSYTESPLEFFPQTRRTRDYRPVEKDW
jgi:Ca-activated chloride channel family protein